MSLISMRKKQITKMDTIHNVSYIKLKNKQNQMPMPAFLIILKHLSSLEIKKIILIDMKC